MTKPRQDFGFSNDPRSSRDARGVIILLHLRKIIKFEDHIHDALPHM
ncbi:MAG TPA: hypothetical protein VGO47_12035 [Chlamydiales bacterium]|nr:hypothetical protein [Chlamydiales bacterium]